MSFLILIIFFYNFQETKQKRRKSESAFRSKTNKLPNYKSFAINTYLKIERVNISNYSKQNGHSQLSLSNDLHIVLNVKFCHFFERKKIISLWLWCLLNCFFSLLEDCELRNLSKEKSSISEPLAPMKNAASVDPCCEAMNEFN